MTSFEGDVLLFNTQDGGNIEFINGQPLMTGGFETMIYLLLFGGNVEDDGLSGNKKTWWGNIDETNPSHRYISRFQNLMRGIPLISSNLRRLEEAALADLEVFKTEKIAAEVTAVASIPALNTLLLVINVNSAQGENTEVKYLINWKTFNVSSAA